MCGTRFPAWLIDAEGRISVAGTLRIVGRDQMNGTPPQRLGQVSTPMRRFPTTDGRFDRYAFDCPRCRAHYPATTGGMSRVIERARAEGRTKILLTELTSLPR
jgi:hypothetical protein